MEVQPLAVAFKNGGTATGSFLLNVTPPAANPFGEWRSERVESRGERGARGLCSAQLQVSGALRPGSPVGLKLSVWGKASEVQTVVGSVTTFNPQFCLDKEPGFIATGAAKDSLLAGNPWTRFVKIRPGFVSPARLSAQLKCVGPGNDPGQDITIILEVGSKPASGPPPAPTQE